MILNQVHAFFDRLGVDDPGARQLLAPQFSWWISGLGQVDGQFVEFGAAMAKHVDAPVRFKVIDALVSDREAFVEVEETASLRNGTSYAIMSAYRLKFGADGLITTVREYTDTKTLSDIWTPLLS